MHSGSSRDAMKARVAAAFAKWRAFTDMPETKAVGSRTPVAGDTDEQKNYVEALYACCEDSVPIGRDGNVIVGDAVEQEPLDPPKGRHMKAGKA